MNDIDLMRYYPKRYDIDMNGRSLPWEAITLIPFVDQVHVQVIEEKYLKDAGTDERCVVDLPKNEYKQGGKYFKYRASFGTSKSLTYKSELDCCEDVSSNLIKESSQNFVKEGVSFEGKLRTTDQNVHFPSLHNLPIEKSELKSILVKRT